MNDFFQKLNKESVKELFSKNWLTHDAMWYGLAMQELGPEKGNYLNQAAARLMGSFEIKRFLKIMGKPEQETIHTFDELRLIIDTAFQFVQTSFMKFDYGFPEKNLLSGKFNDCFAYNGVKRFGNIEAYECGIIERVKGWVDGLGVAYEISPNFKGCLMHQQGACIINFHFNLE